MLVTGLTATASGGAPSATRCGQPGPAHYKAAAPNAGPSQRTPQAAAAQWSVTGWNTSRYRLLTPTNTINAITTIAYGTILLTSAR